MQGVSIAATDKLKRRLNQFLEVGRSLLYCEIGGTDEWLHILSSSVKSTGSMGTSADEAYNPDNLAALYSCNEVLPRPKYDLSLHPILGLPIVHQRLLDSVSSLLARDAPYGGPAWTPALCSTRLRTAVRESNIAHRPKWRLDRPRHSGGGLCTA